MGRGWMIGALAVAAATLVGVATPAAPPASAVTVARAITTASTVQGTLATVAAGGMSGGWLGWTIEVLVSGNADPVGEGAAAADGSFTIGVDDAVPQDGVAYVVAHAPAAAGHPDAPAAAFASVFPGALPTEPVVLNERTTVASAVAMAQFVSNAGVSGTAPGLVNSAGMAANLADPFTGALAETLTTSPNGSETSTLAEFDSLTAALASCATAPFADPVRFADGTCAELLDVGSAAGSPSGAVPVDTFRAFAEIIRNPGVSPERLFDVSQTGALADGSPVLDRAPVAWTVALRFDGDGQSLAGPGNFAVDYQGNIWVINNYQYNADPHTPVCGSDKLFKFSPTGAMTTFTGGGLSGAGYGVDIDPHTGNVWVANYGFAAPAPGCPAADQPPHNSASLFTAAGSALSPATGYTQGGLNWPQGVAIDPNSSVWFANCNTDTVTIYPKGDPAAARTIPADQLNLTQPFDVVDNGRSMFVSGIVNDSVDTIGYDGSVLASSPGVNAAFDHPMGLAADAGGTVWAANSAVIALPCPTVPNPPSSDAADPTAGFQAILGTTFDSRGMYTGGANPYIGSIAAISPDGARVTQYTGGGATVPWGITTDGDGNVWVANFAGKRLSAFCGTDEASCPAGKRTGDPLSPDLTGYYFDGLVRNTGVAVDQSGNVWLANNWDEVPIQTNPGGHQIVAYLGLAAPVTIAAPAAVVVPTPTPTPTPSAPAAASTTSTAAPGAALAATGASAGPLAGAAALALLFVVAGLFAVRTRLRSRPTKTSARR
ncbi:NHL repeat-containing protein [Subtercola endophyticus]|uniref:hypothetical protein n=1 Tax=Subtercola endophyticus TaxID=2895559 RepID=UPI001E2A101E|nr:hypothetical protein [Subtercola endophyticus]UFS59625.1 hypothetical protein LQ955_02150 [Subtercola endophyticus]